MAVSIKLAPEERQRLRALAAVKGRSPHFLMREAIRQHLDREEARESFKQEASASWAEHQETGLHLTGREVAEWLGSWGRPGRRKTPKWHE